MLHELHFGIQAKGIEYKWKLKFSDFYLLNK